ncbi:hypothetical protein AX14_004459 [Amanita brunnescens Koide BX004]|nr:hypothetical protein AX14_004459 [Amanita brunnescens Koide BX004]
MPMSPISTHFGCLDELTQVIYQSVYRFVVLSSITVDEWIIHVGLADSQGRWWQGRWSQDNVDYVLGSKAGDKLHESLAEKLRESLLRGNLYIGNWDLGTNINLTFGPGSKDSVEIPLREIEPREAADFATNIFLEIALQAQARGCRLHPSYSAYATTVTKEPILAKPHMATKYSLQPAPVKRGTADVAAEERSSHSNVNAVKVRESDSGAVKHGERETRTVEKKGQGAGASLANPNKKARKYAAIEFESDED